jgi:hypothetical protein
MKTIALGKITPWVRALSRGAVAAVAGLSLLGAPANAQTCGQSAWWLLNTDQPGTPPGPGPRAGASMAYDSVRHVTVLFGGISNGTARADTWEWDGRTWSLRQDGSGTAHPSARFWSAMAFDSTRNRTVLVSGTADAVNGIRDTWEWNGTAWTRESTSGPIGRFKHTLVFDSARGRAVLFGGGANGNNFGDTWEWSGSSWVQRSTAGCPPRFGHASAFDSARNVTVVFGGLSEGVPMGDTWEWNGTSWSQRSGQGPTARAYAAMAYDSVLSKIVLFGGTRGGVAQNDTWEMTSGGWLQTPADAASSPAGRSQHAMVYDGARGTMVLHGGAASATTIFSDTWAYGLAAAPTILVAPVPTTAAFGSTAVFTVRAAGVGPLSYRWRKGTVFLEDGGNISGARTAQLSISDLSAADAGQYRVTATNACGNTATPLVTLTVACLQDINSDGAVNIQDFLAFASFYQSSDPRADFDRNGLYNVQDALAFFAAFANGCP